MLHPKMVFPNPSIESYFRPLSTTSPASSSFPDGDGFTDEELVRVPSTVNSDGWTPGKEYDRVEIAFLTGGPRPVLIQGRVVNFYDQLSSATKKPNAANGCLKMIVKDDTGAISVSSFSSPCRSPWLTIS
jgi:hypothetical protein